MLQIQFLFLLLHSTLQTAFLVPVVYQGHKLETSQPLYYLATDSVGFSDPPQNVLVAIDDYSNTHIVGMVQPEYSTCEWGVEDCSLDNEKAPCFAKKGSRDTAFYKEFFYTYLDGTVEITFDQSNFSMPNIPVNLLTVQSFYYPQTAVIGLAPKSSLFQNMRKVLNLTIETFYFVVDLPRINLISNFSSRTIGNITFNGYNESKIVKDNLIWVESNNSERWGVDHLKFSADNQELVLGDYGACFSMSLPYLFSVSPEESARLQEYYNLKICGSSTSCANSYSLEKVPNLTLSINDPISGSVFSSIILPTDFIYANEGSWNYLINSDRFAEYKQVCSANDSIVIGLPIYSKLYVIHSIKPNESFSLGFAPRLISMKIYDPRYWIYSLAGTTAVMMIIVIAALIFKVQNRRLVKQKERGHQRQDALLPSIDSK